jgi:hypothetical protein
MQDGPPKEHGLSGRPSPRSGAAHNAADLAIAGNVDEIHRRRGAQRRMSDAPRAVADYWLSVATGASEDYDENGARALIG